MLKKHTLKLIAILLVSTMVVGCSGKSNDNSSDIGSESTVSQQQTSESVRNEESSSIEKETESTTDKSEKESVEETQTTKEEESEQTPAPTQSSTQPQTQKPTQAPTQSQTQAPTQSQTQAPTQAKKNVKTTFLSWSYKSISAAGNGYYIVSDDNTNYKLINTAGNTIKSGIKDYYTALHKGAYYMEYSDGRQELYNSSHSLIWSNTGNYAGYKYESYSEGILVLYDSSVGMIFGRYTIINVEQNMKVICAITEHKLNEYTMAYAYATVGPCVNGYLNITGASANGLPESKSVLAMDKAGNFITSSEELESLGSDADGNGWILVSDASGVSSDKYLYNLKTKEKRKATYITQLMAGSGFKWKNYIPVNGGRVHALNGYMFIAPYDKADDKDWSVYNYLQDKVVATFDSITLDDYSSGKMLVSKNGKWGYADKNFNVSVWYDDAAAFSNGYAIIKKNGKLYVVDTSMQIVSEAIEGVGVSMLRKDNRFAVMGADGKYTVMTVEKQ